MFDRFNERVKRLSFVDIKLIKWGVFFATIIIVKLFPQLLKINYWMLIVLMVACSVKPAYRFWFKK